MTPKQERLLLYVMVLAMICFWLWLAVFGEWEIGTQSHPC